MKNVIGGLLLLSSLQVSSAVVMSVDYSDFLDDDQLTNSISFTGIDGVNSQSDASTTNFPIIYLESFFNTEMYFPIHELEATSAGLSDMNGRAYSRAIDGDSYTNLEGRYFFPQNSIGMLAENRAVQNFSTLQSAFGSGSTIFDFTGYGFTASDFRRGGDLYANSDSPTDGYVLVGQWSVSPVPIPAAIWLFGSGLIGLVGLARRKNT